jgi:hypothetical protein
MTRPARKQTRDMTAKLLAHYACAWCGVVTRAEVLESAEGDRVCPACMDAEHAESEREDECYDGPVHEAEGWK